MSEADELVELQHLLADLSRKLETMPVIEQAKGVVMARTGCTADEAFDTLRDMSMRDNRRLRDVAADVVAETAHTRN